MALTLTSRSAPQEARQARSWLATAGIALAATVFVAICAHISMPLPWTPVPLVAGDFAVLMVGFFLGPQIGFATLVLYLVEGAAGLPMFSPQGPGGVAQLLGPTGGFLLAYPTVAAVAGALRSRSNGYGQNFVAAILASLVLFTCGALYLQLVTGFTSSETWDTAIRPFLPAAVLKCAAAAAIISVWGANAPAIRK